MPHDGQIPFLAVMRGLAALCSFILFGCARSGDVVVVLDSTMRAEMVEVVAMPLEYDDDGDAARQNLADVPPDSLERLRALEDSSATLAVRFRTLRDSLNSEVRSLENLDRRTRAYALRYAEIRRRTLAAESIRSVRDAMRSRADSLRIRLGVAAAPRSRPDPGSTDPATRVAEGSDGRKAERRAVQDSTVVLTLAPGRWGIGAAHAGARPSRFETVTVETGSTDTLRLAPPAFHRQ
jgi:hypothetical protein